ncbi:MAG TPA: alpha/beta hydrolase [Gemmatimonadaceae bacterium]|jgi:pimeloyl-ACP methyl ester carboxylesterase|nr:alpha/beta hydrolase [Gemmatimonadaceae bacterium]
MSPDSLGARVAALVSTIKASVAPKVSGEPNGVAPARAPSASRAHAPPTRTGYAWVNGLRMYYEVHGEGGEVPLILLHGGGSTITTSFGRILPLLKETHPRVIAVEFQAHGHTRDVDRAFTFEQDADDVAALMDHLYVERATVFGFSNGGTVALQVAIRHPEKVERLIVASANYRKDGMHPWFWDVMNKGTFADMPQVYKDEYLKLDPRQEGLFTMYERDSRRMMQFEDIPDSLIQGIEAPTFVVTGDKDVVRPEQAIDLSRLVQHGRLCILPGGHGEYFGEIMFPSAGDAAVRRFVGLANEFLLAQTE